MKQIKKLALYIRCSTNKQEITVQKDELYTYIDYLKNRNKDIDYIVYEYIDEGISGSKLDRPQFNRLMGDLKNNAFDVIIITKLDRLSRSLRDLMNTVESIKNHKCDFIVVKDNIDTSTAQGRLLFHVISSFAEFERDVIAERMKKGRDYAEKHGTKTGKPCHRPKVDIDVDGIVHKYKSGMSMNKIADSYGVSITVIKSRLKERGEYQPTYMKVN